MGGLWRGGLAGGVDLQQEEKLQSNRYITLTLTAEIILIGKHCFAMFS